MELVIKKEYSLSLERWEEIKKPFYQFADKFKEYEDDIKNVISESEKWITLELSKKAKRLKLDIAQIRIWTWKLKDSEKAEALNIWRAIQSCHNTIVDVVSESEEKLNSIVKHFENLEKERIENLQKEREGLLLAYEVDNIEALELGIMDKIVFNNFLTWSKSKYDAKIEAVKQEKIKAKEEQEKRDEEIRKETEERVKQELEEESKRKEQEAKDKLKRAKELAKEKAEKEKRKVEADKRDVELKRVQELQRVEKEKQDLIDKQEEQKKQDIIKAEKIKKELEEESKRKEQEKAKLEKQENYRNWRKELWYNEENKTDFIEKKEEWKIVLYKKVWEFKI